VLVWLAISVVMLCRGTMPIGPHLDKPVAIVIPSSIALVFLVVEIGLVALNTRARDSRFGGSST
jgi:hypothetical protein